MLQFALVVGLVICVAIIAGILSAFAVHEHLWHRLPRSVAKAIGGALGLTICALLVFVMMWKLNPDPSGGFGAVPTIGGTASLTGFAALFWVPVFLASYASMTRRRSSR